MRRHLLFIIFLILLIPDICFGQGKKKINGTVALSDAAWNQYNYLSVHVISFGSIEDAESFLSKHRDDPGANDINILDRTKLTFSKINNSIELNFSIEGIIDGYVVTLPDNSKYFADSDIRKITKNLDRLSITIDISAQKKIENTENEFSEETLKNAGIEKSDNGDLILSEQLITAEKGNGGEVRQRTLDEDGNLILRIDSVAISCHTIRPNSRVIIQPYWLDGPDEAGVDTFAFAKPAVLDLKEYDITQTRLMDFNKQKNDLLSPYFVDNNKPLGTKIRFDSDTLILINYKDSVSGFNPDESYPYPARAIICIEDYNERYLDTVKYINEGERTNYFKFLEMSYEKDLTLDFHEFEEKMEILALDGDGSLQLKFENGQAVLKDTASLKALMQVKDSLREQLNQEGSSLTFLQVYGYASPEGNLATNERLAKERAQYAINAISEAVPSKMRKAIKSPDSEVNSWQLIADSLRRDGYEEYALQVESAIKERPNDISAQYGIIRNQSWYQSDRDFREHYLSMLRTVKYSFMTKINRELTANELIERYNEGNVGSFTKAHYWKLLKYYWDIRDKKDMVERIEEIAKFALADTKKNKDDLSSINDSLYNDGYWALAASVLATCYLDRGYSDRTVLQPFIDTTTIIKNDTVVFKTKPTKNLDYSGLTFIQYTNDPKMIALQIMMLIEENNRSNLQYIEKLMAMIRDDETIRSNDNYQRMFALADCSLGFWREKPGRCTAEHAAEVRNYVSSTSITNSIIIDIAVADGEQNKDYLQHAIDHMDEMPEDKGRSWYLKAIIQLMRRDISLEEKKLLATKDLAKAYELDLSLMPISNNDEQLISDSREKIVRDSYYKWKDIMEKSSQTEAWDEEKLLEDAERIEGYKATGYWDEEMKQDYKKTIKDESHPYTWYSRAIEAIGNYSGQVSDSISIVEMLDKCVSLDSKYLYPIRLAYAKDLGGKQTIENNIGISENRKILLRDFYLRKNRELNASRK